MPQEKTTKEKLLEKLYSLSHNVIWEIEASREIEGKSFIKPSDLKRITELIDNISNDVKKAISQTREETIREVENILDNYFKGLIMIPMPELTLNKIKQSLYKLKK